MKCRFRGLADHSHVKQVHVECKANKETAPARGPAGGGVVTRRRNTDGGGRGGWSPGGETQTEGGGSTSPPWDCLGRLMGNSPFYLKNAPKPCAKKSKLATLRPKTPRPCAITGRSAEVTYGTIPLDPPPLVACQPLVQSLFSAVGVGCECLVM